MISLNIESNALMIRQNDFSWAFMLYIIKGLKILENQVHVYASNKKESH